MVKLTFSAGNNYHLFADKEHVGFILFVILCRIIQILSSTLDLAYRGLPTAFLAHKTG
jgi:hypothetical protein